jgi:hypothetical protein
MVRSKVPPMRIPRSIHRFLNRLGPYQALLTLAVPLAIVEPLKLVALFVVGGGHFIAGVLVMICAYAGSLFITERLFVVLKPKLLTLPWFAFAWRWFVTVRDNSYIGYAERGRECAQSTLILANPRVPSKATRSQLLYPRTVNVPPGR